MLMSKIADDAIGLFLEYRDRHGYDEPAARAKAVQEVVEGTFGSDTDIPLPDPDTL